MIVLTGGAGFIGSGFLAKLNENNINDVIVVDHLGSDNKWKNLVGKKFFRYYHKQEFYEQIKNGSFKTKISAVIHLGACSTTTETDVDYLMQNNLNYSIDLAEFALKNNAKFIYASSASTYGDGLNGYSDYHFNSLKPLNPYGFSKHMFDEWVIENKYDSKFVGLKFFNVFGPNEYHKGPQASMVYKSYNQIHSTGKVRLFVSDSPAYADGDQKRDFVYVRDCCEVIWKMYNSKEIAGIFNLGTGTARSWNDLARAVFKAMKKEPKIEYVEMPQNLKGQYQNFTQADMFKLNKTDCSIKFMTLEESVDDYVNNFLVKDLKQL